MGFNLKGRKSKANRSTFDNIEFIEIEPFLFPKYQATGSRKR